MNPTEALHERKMKMLYDDIITTACEGGINYWAQVDRDDDGIVIIDSMDEAQEIRPLDHKTITHAFQTVMLDAFSPSFGEKKRYPDWIARAIAFAWGAMDAGDIDADLADAIVQIGTFGEIRYS